MKTYKKFVCGRTVSGGIFHEWIVYSQHVDQWNLQTSAIGFNSWVKLTICLKIYFIFQVRSVIPIVLSITSHMKTRFFIIRIIDIVLAMDDFASRFVLLSEIVILSKCWRDHSFANFAYLAAIHVFFCMRLLSIVELLWIQIFNIFLCV